MEIKHLLVATGLVGILCTACQQTDPEVPNNPKTLKQPS